MPKVSANRKAICKTRLLELLKPGDTVYCVLRHISKSGMMRVIDLYTSGHTWIGKLVADLTEDTYVDKYGGGIKAQGCGMDMGFALVYNLSYALFHDSNLEAPANLTNKSHGYWLRHQWL